MTCEPRFTIKNTIPHDESQRLYRLSYTLTDANSRLSVLKISHFSNGRNSSRVDDHKAVFVHFKFTIISSHLPHVDGKISGRRIDLFDISRLEEDEFAKV